MRPPLTAHQDALLPMAPAHWHTLQTPTSLRGRSLFEPVMARGARLHLPLRVALADDDKDAKGECERGAQQAQRKSQVDAEA